MILEKQTEANVLTEGQSQESIGMSLDLDSAQVLMQMLSKNLYSDDIGSAIRECASNALDSHRRAGVDTPIVVSFKPSAASNYEFCVEDFGIGLDADDVKNIISKYGKSTKRESNTELGMMGLGFKAPLAYSSSFYFVCRKDGMERKYMMYEGEDVNTIDLLHEVATTEGNGVKIIIPVRYQDAYQFRKKIKEQLCYFESVYFDVPEDSTITNDFVISRHTHFQFSEMSTDDRVHICLDNVYYPLDFEKLGIDRIDFPVGLRFSLSDGLYPTPNRESLRYTQEAKQIILSKLSNVADYFVNKYNEQLGEGNDIASVINHLEKNGHRLTMPNGTPRTIDDFIKFSTIKVSIPEIDGVKLINFPSLYKTYKQNMLNDAFPSNFLLRYKRMSNTDKHYSWGYNLESICNGSAKVWVYNDRIPGIKKDYLRATCKESEYNFIVKRASPMKLGIPAKFDIKTYYHLLHLKDYPKSQWRAVIKEYQHIMSLVEDQFIDLDELVVPQAFVDSKKKAKVAAISTGSTKRLKIQGEIVCKKGVELMRWNDGRKCKFDSQLYKLEDLESAKHLKVYAHHDDYLKLDALYGVMGKQKMEVITFSSRELKIVEGLEVHNLISYDKFMEGKNAPFKRIITSMLINDMISKYRSVFEKTDIIRYVSSDLADKLKAMSEYKTVNYHDHTGDLKAAMLEVAQEHNLFDQNIYPEYLQMLELFEKLSFLQPLCSRMGYFNEEDAMVNVMTDLFKYYKHRVNFKHYNIRINEEVLTEETVEQLID
jgi:hypothetical protein